jgi:signal transduction histidine kinase/ligand-binding sensor domain-containing protein
VSGIFHGSPFGRFAVLRGHAGNRPKVTGVRHLSKLSPILGGFRRRGPARLTGCPLVLLGILLLMPGRAWPLSADVTLQQLNHRAFTSAEGAPSDVAALAQTSDGTLWIAGGVGLSRFDGVRFVPYPGPSEEPLPSTNISTLMATPDGGLWIGFTLGGTCFLKAGHLATYPEGDGFPGGTVKQFAWDHDGSVWAAAAGGLVHFKENRWEKVAFEATLGSPMGVVIDRAGTLWFLTSDVLLARPPGESGFREVDRREFHAELRSRLVVSSDGKIWATATHEVIRVERPEDLQRSTVVRISGISGSLLAVDNAGNLWAGDIGPLSRATARDLHRDGETELVVRPQRFSHADGLSSSSISALLEDREGNIWVGTGAGLDRFSDSSVLRYDQSCEDPGLVAGEAGALWVACNQDGAALEEIREGVVRTYPNAETWSVAYRDPQGNIWIAGRAGIGRLVNGHVVGTSPIPENARGFPVQALVRDDSGALWVSIVRRGIYRYLDGEWSEYGNVEALPRGPAVVETADGTGSIWFGYPKSRVARMNSRVVQLFDATQGLNVGNVQAILARGAEVWVGGELGFARFDGTRFAAVRGSSGTSFKGISGIVSTRDGDFWLNTIAGIVHIARQEIERVVRNPADPVKFETFDYLDGVPGTAVQLRPLPSAVETTDGHIWFAMSAGIVSIDVAHLVRNTLPPPVTIWSLTSGPKRYPIPVSGLLLPAHTASLQIEYSAGSLTVPERVHFRYKLEGLDRDWQEAGGRREALYTNLGPGHYTFRVTAANNDGVWNEAGASLDFAVSPAFYQTAWFRGLCMLALLLLLWELYQVRIRQLQRRFNIGLEATVNERTRIARELHDTLLQTLHGLMFQFQAARNLMPRRPDEALRSLDDAINETKKALGESREAIQGLRSESRAQGNLSERLMSSSRQLAASAVNEAPPQLDLVEEGEPQTLSSAVGNEVYRIGLELIRNAYQHAQARRIEVEVRYGDQILRMRIRDDGIGIDPHVSKEGGRAGHWGLPGIRERAERIGARLDLWSELGRGTEVELQVPAAVAYERPRESFLMKLARKVKSHAVRS